MSVRAYRVEEIKMAEENSFNLWQDTELMNFLEEKGGYSLATNADGYGLMDVSVEVLKESLKKTDIPEETKKSIKKDIEWAEKEGEDYIQYYCL